MTDQAITERASFERIRYAQAWEDADVLTQAMGDKTGEELVSVCASGDNALALLLCNPAKVHAVDISSAQLECLHLRLGAYQHLIHAEFLELMGARKSTRRKELLATALQSSSEKTRQFWQSLVPEIERYGAAGVGKFESYFRIFSRRLLPLVHSQKTIDGIFAPKTISERESFYRDHFNGWRWRLLINLFFSRWMMARLGRDKAFFEHVEGSVAQHVLSKVRHAAVDTDPAKNPYLYWIMKRTHGNALPLSWREEHYQTIRDRLDRVEPHLGSLEGLGLTNVKGFYLSDIFEYMSPSLAETAYGEFLAMAGSGARLVYWNMMAPRRVPKSFARCVVTQTELENTLKAQDMAFFYSDFVVEEVV